MATSRTFREMAHLSTDRFIKSPYGSALEDVPESIISFYSVENEIIFIILTHWRLHSEMNKEMILKKKKDIPPN